MALNRNVPKDDYNAAVVGYSQIAADIETQALEDRFEIKGALLAPPRQPQKDRDGDVAMVNVAIMSTARRDRGSTSAKYQENWVPDELFKHRRDAGLCTYCGKDGHLFRTCPNAVVL